MSLPIHSGARVEARPGASWNEALLASWEAPRAMQRSCTDTLFLSMSKPESQRGWLTNPSHQLACSMLLNSTMVVFWVPRRSRALRASNKKKKESWRRSFFFIFPKSLVLVRERVHPSLITRALSGNNDGNDDGRHHCPFGHIYARTLFLLVVVVVVVAIT